MGRWHATNGTGKDMERVKDCKFWMKQTSKIMQNTLEHRGFLGGFDDNKRVSFTKNPVFSYSKLETQ